jgi:hypothetical protein
MGALNYARLPGPGDFLPPDELPRVVTTEDVVNEWMQDDSRLLPAVETVVDTMGHRDPLVSDFHCALVGHDMDRVARALRLLLAIESKVKHELALEAVFEAKRRNGEGA